LLARERLRPRDARPGQVSAALAEWGAAGVRGAVSLGNVVDRCNGAMRTRGCVEQALATFAELKSHSWRWRLSHEHTPGVLRASVLHLPGASKRPPPATRRPPPAARLTPCASGGRGARPRAHDSRGARGADGVRAVRAGRARGAAVPLHRLARGVAPALPRHPGRALRPPLTPPLRPPCAPLAPP